MLTAEDINGQLRTAREFLRAVVAPAVVNSMETPIFDSVAAAALQAEDGPYRDLVQAMTYVTEVQADQDSQVADKVLAGLALAIYVDDMRQAKKLAISIRKELDPDTSLTSLFGKYLSETSIGPEVSGEDVFSVELE